MYNYLIKTICSTKLKSSTLVEVLVAIAICMVIFTLSLNIILKSERENNMQLKLKAELLQERIFADMGDDVDLGIDTLRIDNLVICRSIFEHDEIPGLLSVTCKSFTKNMKPLSVKQVLIKKRQNNE